MNAGLKVSEHVLMVRRDIFALNLCVYFLLRPK